MGSIKRDSTASKCLFNQCFGHFLPIVPSVHCQDVCIDCWHFLLSPVEDSNFNRLRRWLPFPSDVTFPRRRGATWCCMWAGCAAACGQNQRAHLFASHSENRLMVLEVTKSRAYYIASRDKVLKLFFSREHNKGIKLTAHHFDPRAYPWLSRSMFRSLSDLWVMPQSHSNRFSKVLWASPCCVSCRLGQLDLKHFQVSLRSK